MFENKGLECLILFNIDKLLYMYVNVILIVKQIYSRVITIEKFLKISISGILRIYLIVTEKYFSHVSSKYIKKKPLNYKYWHNYAITAHYANQSQFTRIFNKLLIINFLKKISLFLFPKLF